MLGLFDPEDLEPVARRMGIAGCGHKQIMRRADGSTECCCCGHVWQVGEKVNQALMGERPRRKKPSWIPKKKRGDGNAK